VFKAEHNTPLHDQLSHIKTGIEHAARKTNSTYFEMLQQFLEIYKEKIRPEIRQELETELSILRNKEPKLLS